MTKTEKGKTADPKPTQQSNKRKIAAGKTDGSQKRPKKEGITAFKSSAAPKAEKYATFASSAVLGSPLYCSTSVPHSFCSLKCMACLQDGCSYAVTPEREEEKPKGRH